MRNIIVRIVYVQHAYRETIHINTKYTYILTSMCRTIPHMTTKTVVYTTCYYRRNVYQLAPAEYT